MAKLAVSSKRKAVYQWLLARIIAGDFAPNTPLVIDELARTLDVSPIPIREALQQLEAEGFVVIRPYAGVTVSDLKPGMISEIFVLLETVEVISGRMACLNVCDDNLVEIERLLRQMDQVLDDPDEWSQLNAEFHKLICQCSGATLVTDIMERMLLHWDRLRRHYLEDVFGKRIDKAHADHWQMYYAIRDRDPDRLEAVVREHNRSALKDYIDHLHRSGYGDDQVPVVWSLEAT
ncbi:MAG: GntR family transcriptional regulator [Caldilineae bacterium]|nr:MAG: GntR family transcriptional regulator [Caldilineae bacterium]